ncbi:hypothetical protein [Methylocapsa acidiphila]|uniref:hypothetical protein n=1 Tax=Methylocapsa acidiphila TaxID=133552 RepID=UPI0012EC008B|nr:hypothetical protein [Methylocapsa acidiphila]
MSIDVDGFGVLRIIAENPQIFSDIAAEINKAARALVVGQLKAKTINLARVRAVYDAIGGDAFAHVLDGLADPAAASLIKKLDKNHPDIATASAEWRRRRISELAQGSVEPAAKAKAEPKQKAAKSAKPSKPKVERALGSKAMAAKWDGKNRDE